MSAGGNGGAPKALVLQYGPLGPAGLLGAWLDERGFATTTHRVDEQPDATPAPDAFTMVACLGSKHSPEDATEPSVVAGRATLTRAVERDVPVLGLCFGGQLLASVLGGDIHRLVRPELGWHTIESDDRTAIPQGPWLQWHWYRFTTPPGAREIARSAAGPQAFRHGRHLGVQFHPESTIEIVRRWAEADRERLVAEGVPDGVALLEEGRAHARAAADDARTFFDGFWHGARNGRSN